MPRGGSERCTAARLELHATAGMHDLEGGDGAVFAAARADAVAERCAGWPPTRPTRRCRYERATAPAAKLERKSGRGRVGRVPARLPRSFRFQKSKRRIPRFPWGAPSRDGARARGGACFRGWGPGCRPAVHAAMARAEQRRRGVGGSGEPTECWSIPGALAKGVDLGEIDRRFGISTGAAWSCAHIRAPASSSRRARGVEAARRRGPGEGLRYWSDLNRAGARGTPSAAGRYKRRRRADTPRLARFGWLERVEGAWRAG